MEKSAKIIRMDLDSLAENSVLQCGTEINAKKIGAFIDRFGLVAPPVVAAADGGNGKYKIIKGVEICEAAKKSNVTSMDAVLISDNDPLIQTTMSLSLSTLRESENAISQGHMIKIIVGEGVKLEELAETVGKSKSWISKRHSLVNKLHPEVMDMVANGMVKPRVAEEVARLPKEVQTKFVSGALFKGKELSKDKIHLLIKLFNSDETSDSTKRNILHNPRRVVIAEIEAEKKAREAEIAKDPYRAFEMLLEKLIEDVSVAMSRLAVFDDLGRLMEMRKLIGTLSKLSTDFGGRLGDTAEKIDKRPRRFPGETARGEAGGREAPAVKGRDGPEGPAPRTGGYK